MHKIVGCVKNYPHPTTASILRQLCDDLAAAEEEGEESAGQDAGHRGRHQAKREPHALLNWLNDPKSHRDWGNIVHSFVGSVSGFEDSARG